MVVRRAVCVVDVVGSCKSEWCMIKTISSRIVHRVQLLQREASGFVVYSYS